MACSSEPSKETISWARACIVSASPSSRRCCCTTPSSSMASRMRFARTEGPLRVRREAREIMHASSEVVISWRRRDISSLVAWMVLARARRSSGSPRPKANFWRMRWESWLRRRMMVILSRRRGSLSMYVTRSSREFIMLRDVEGEPIGG